MLTEAEKWRFDLHGYLVLKQAVPSADVSRMLELSEAWHAKEDADLPVPLQSYKDPSNNLKTPRSINHVEYVDEVFQRLILNPEIMRVVLALTDNAPQHLGCALTRNTSDSDALAFHGGVSGGIHHPANDYQAADGKAFATLLAALLSNCGCTKITPTLSAFARLIKSSISLPLSDFPSTSIAICRKP